MTPAVFSHGDLRLYLLSLLSEGPQHGYGIIQSLNERTGGTYVPSAGTIYPRLAKLEEEGLVTKRVDGRTSVYAITDAGRAELHERENEMAGIEQGLADSVRLIAGEVRSSVQEAMKSLRADLAAAAQQQRQDASRAADQARTAAAEDRTAAREQAQRAEAVINDFRGQVRTELRRHVATGGTIPRETISALEESLERTATALGETLRTLR